MTSCSLITLQPTPIRAAPHTHLNGLGTAQWISMERQFESPESFGRWCKVWMTVLVVLALVGLLAAVAVSILRNSPVTGTQVALVSAACMWLLAAVSQLPRWRRYEVRLRGRCDALIALALTVAPLRDDDVMSNIEQEPVPETFASAIIVTHLDGTQERFPVTITRQAPARHEEER